MVTLMGDFSSPNCPAEAGGGGWWQGGIYSIITTFSVWYFVQLHVPDMLFQS